MSEDTITIDIHGMRFIEAKTEILDTLEGYCKTGYTKFEIIHGYKSGQVIRNYVRSRLKPDFESKNKIYLLSISNLDKGTSLVRVVKK